MKILVCGKGGTGKTVLSILLAKAFLERGFRPYILDMDESNELLPSLLGVESPRPLAEYFGGRRGLSEKLKQGENTVLNMIAELVKKGELKIGDIPEPYVKSSQEGIKLLTIGKIRNFSEGCACPLNTLAKLILKNFRLEPQEVLIVDTDAGVEHVGRGVEEYCTDIVAIVDNTRESAVLARYLSDVAAKLRKRFWTVLNKVMEKQRDIMMKVAEQLGLRVDIVVPYDDKILESCMLGKKLEYLETTLDNVKTLVSKILSTA